MSKGHTGKYNETRYKCRTKIILIYSLFIIFLTKIDGMNRVSISALQVLSIPNIIKRWLNSVRFCMGFSYLYALNYVK